MDNTELANLKYRPADNTANLLSSGAAGLGWDPEIFVELADNLIHDVRSGDKVVVIMEDHEHVEAFQEFLAAYDTQRVFGNQSHACFLSPDSIQYNSVLIGPAHRMRYGVSLIEYNGLYMCAAPHEAWGALQIANRLAGVPHFGSRSARPAFIKIALNVHEDSGYERRHLNARWLAEVLCDFPARLSYLQLQQHKNTKP